MLIIKMAESIPPLPKKGKRSVLISRATAEERARQFESNLYSNGGVLFCRFCEHSVDFTLVDTVKDHLKSKKHAAKKEAKSWYCCEIEGVAGKVQICEFSA